MIFVYLCDCFDESQVSDQSKNHRKIRLLAQRRKKCCANGSPPEACETLSVGVQDATNRFGVHV